MFDEIDKIDAEIIAQCLLKQLDAKRIDKMAYEKFVKEGTEIVEPTKSFDHYFLPHEIVRHKVGERVKYAKGWLEVYERMEKLYMLSIAITGRAG